MKFGKIAVAAVAGLTLGAAPAYAANPAPTVDVEAYENEVASSGLSSPVQVGGRFYAISNGKLTRYDWTTGEWAVVTSSPRNDLRDIATDGTTLVALTTGDETLYLSGGAWLAANSRNFDMNASKGVASGQGFVALTGYKGYPLVSIDGGQNYRGVDTLGGNVNTDWQSPVQAVAPDYGCGIQWVYGPHTYYGQWDLVTSRGWTKDKQATLTTDRDGDFNVANLGNETWTLAKNGSFARYWDDCNPDGARGATPANNQFLLAAPGLGGVYEISDDNLYQRVGTERTAALASVPDPTGMVDEGNVVLLTSGTGRSWFLAGKLPDVGWTPTTDKDAGVGNAIPDLPPLVPPPDVPAVIDEGNSVIMPDLGVTPKNENGQPVMVASAPWKPNATGWCEWRGNKVACVSEMDALPEADDLYTLRANLSGTSKVRQGACRWTTTKPQCRVWLTQPGKWRLTWSGSNAGKMVSGARTVIVK